MENQVTLSILLFWVFKWRLVWEMLRDWTPGIQPAVSSHAPLPFLSVPPLVCYSTPRKLTLWPIFKAPVDHLPQETFQKISHLWMWVAYWNKLSRQQWEDTAQDDSWHLYLHLAQTHTNSTTLFPTSLAGFLWIAPCLYSCLDMQRGVVSSPSNSPTPTVQVGAPLY